MFISDSSFVADSMIFRRLLLYISVCEMPRASHYHICCAHGRHHAPLHPCGAAGSDPFF